MARTKLSCHPQTTVSGRMIQDERQCNANVAWSKWERKSEKVCQDMNGRCNRSNQQPTCALTFERERRKENTHTHTQDIYLRKTRSTINSESKTAFSQRACWTSWMDRWIVKREHLGTNGHETMLGCTPNHLPEHNHIRKPVVECPSTKREAKAKAKANVNAKAKAKAKAKAN